MGDVEFIYSKLSSIDFKDLSDKEQYIIKSNEGYVQAMLLEISRVCNRYIKMGVEFNMNLQLSSKEDGTLKCSHKNNYIVSEKK